MHSTRTCDPVVRGQSGQRLAQESGLTLSSSLNRADHHSSPLDLEEITHPHRGRPSLRASSTSTCRGRTRKSAHARWSRAGTSRHHHTPGATSHEMSAFTTAAS
eukprot:1050639-Prymnesium_polylepis.2